MSVPQELVHRKLENPRNGEQVTTPKPHEPRDASRDRPPSPGAGDDRRTIVRRFPLPAAYGGRACTRPLTMPEISSTGRPHRAFTMAQKRAPGWKCIANHFPSERIPPGENLLGLIGCSGHGGERYAKALRRSLIQEEAVLNQEIPPRDDEPA